jgi:apolipoprotein N-acyltransferase
MVAKAKPRLASPSLIERLPYSVPDVQYSDALSLTTLCYPCGVLKIHKSAWLLVLLSAGLQVLIFPLPDFYILCWIAMAPLLIGLLRARQPNTLQLQEGIKLLPANPWQAFLLGYVCGILWYAGTCYWIYSTMRQYGGVNAPAALGLLLLFCMYLAIYHGIFGLLVSLLAGNSPFSRRALLLAPPLWVAVELARTRITGFPWDLLGIAQVDNIPLSHISTVTGVYGISFEIMVVNAALAAAFLVHRDKRKPLLLAALGAAVVLQAGRWIIPPTLPTDRTAALLQQNIPILEGADWTKEYFDDTLLELSLISLKPFSPNSTGQDPGAKMPRPSLIAWPESPAPFYTSDPVFRNAVTNLARESQSWIVAGGLGTRNASQNPERETEFYNSASLINPSGEWVARYDKVHLVPFGEYVPFRHLFFFAAGLTKNVGDFSRGTSRAPLEADGSKLGVFICYESIFPDEVRQFAANGAQVFVNVSNDGWYGDSGAYAQHLKQARMRAVENGRWLLRDTNNGVTASIDPFGRVVASAPRKIRTVLVAPFALSNVTTFYTRHGDLFAYLCAIISALALLVGLRRKHGHAPRL